MKKLLLILALSALFVPQAFAAKVYYNFDGSIDRIGKEKVILQL